MSKKQFFPIYSFCLITRPLAWFIITFPLVFPVLELLHLNFWPCPLYFYCGIQCPGCGLTRAAIAILQGNLTDAWHFHPFSLFLCGAWGFLLIYQFIPGKLQEKLLSRIERIERITGIAYIFTALFFFYGFLRMVMQICF